MNKLKFVTSCLVFCIAWTPIFSDVCVGIESIKNDDSFMQVYEKVLSALESEQNSGQWPTEISETSTLLTAQTKTIRLGTCHALFVFLSQQGENLVKRQEITQYLSSLLMDPVYAIQDYVSSRLVDHDLGDFNEASKLNLEKALKIRPSKDTILLADRLQIPGLDKFVEDILRSDSEVPIDQVDYRSVRWAAEIVKARRGNPESLQNILTRIESEKNKNVQAGQYLRELEWIHRPEAVLFLKRFFDSDDKLLPEDSKKPASKVAQYAGVSLARMLKGFPVKKLDYNFTDEELEICRKWMNEQTRWQFETND